MSPELYRTSYSRALALHLSQADLDSRGLLVVGYAPQELLPPYNDLIHRAKAEQIVRYSTQFPFVRRCSSPLQIYNTIIDEEFPSQKVVEIVGGYADFCVPLALSLVISYGRAALIRSMLLISDQSSHSSFTLGRMVMRGVAGDNLRTIKLDNEEFLYTAN